jgi:uncharacterized OB-fold protein
MAEIVAHSFAIDPEALMPAETPENAPYWQGFAQGTLQLQRCAGCDKTRHPVAPVCPHCGGEAFDWVEHSGAGEIFSFVVLHKNYLPEFEHLMPFVIATIQLADGPRMFARLREIEGEVRIGAPVHLVVEDWGRARFVPTFALARTHSTMETSP